METITHTFFMFTLDFCKRLCMNLDKISWYCTNLYCSVFACAVLAHIFMCNSVNDSKTGKNLE